MKLAHLLFAAGLCSFSAAAAQTTPSTAPGAPGTTTASPSAVPRGTAPVNADPNGAVSPGEVFTKGAPTNSNQSDKRAMRRQNKTTKTGKTKMKTTM